MSDIRQLADGNVGPQLSSNCSDDEELVLFSSLRKELEVIVIRTVEILIGPLEPLLEPILRRVVNEQMDLAQERIRTSMDLVPNTGDSEERLDPSQPRKLQLRFRNKLCDQFFTGDQISGEDGNALKIELVDENTGSIVEIGPEASAGVEVVVLRPGDDVAKWSSEMFDQMIVRKREGNNYSLLVGDAHLNLREGIGQVGKISFARRSMNMKKSQYMLGARFTDKFDGIIVGEAISQAFTIEDTRKKYYEKHYPPTLSDAVFRLDKIGKKGTKKLKQANIKTVKDILEQYFKDHQRLIEILGITDKVLDVILAHALTCKELEEKYIYHIPSSQQQIGVVFNILRQFLGLHTECHFIPKERLSQTQKDEAVKSVAYAFKHLGDVVRYDEHSLFSQPNASTINITSSNICTETSLEISGYDHLQSSTSYPNIMSSDILTGTSHTNHEYDNTEPTTPCSNTVSFNNLSGAPQPTTPSSLSDNNSIDFSNDNFELPLIAPEDIVQLNDSSEESVWRTIQESDTCPCSIFDMEIDDAMENLDEHIRSPIHFTEDLMNDSTLSFENLLNEVESKARIRKWFKKLAIVAIFSFRKRMEEADHARKRKKSH